MRISILLSLLIAFNISFSQDTSWKKFRIDSNLILEFIGDFEKIAPMAIEKYSYDIYSAKTGRAIYMAMVGSSKDEIRIFNNEDYRRALDKMVEGAVKAAGENNWSIAIADTLIDGLPGKKMSYSGKYATIDARGYSYFFLVNGLGYTISAIFLNPALSAKDSIDLNHFVSSIDFTDNIREKQFSTRTEYIAYESGRLIAMLIILAVIILVIIFVIRSI